MRNRPGNPRPAWTRGKPDLRPWPLPGSSAEKLARLQSDLPLSIPTADGGVMRIPAPAREYRFDGTRKWRFDFAWPAVRIALEVEGGIFTQGRHSRGAGMLKDFEKYNEAAIQGWRVFKCTPEQVRNGAATLLIYRAIVEKR